MSVVKKKSSNKITKMDKVIFESYKDVINERMSAGKDVTNLTTRLNELVSKNKKLFFSQPKAGPGFSFLPDPAVYLIQEV